MSQQLTDKQLIHRQYLESPVWKAKRQEALEHYGCICGRCKKHGTDVHHKTYERVGGAELMEDLEVLCRLCHEAHHRVERATRSKSATKDPRRINRRAIFQYLTGPQKDKLIKDFRLEGRNDLSLQLGHTQNNHLAITAAKMLGFDSFYGKPAQKQKAKYKNDPAPARKEKSVTNMKISIKISKQLSKKGISPDAFRARPDYFLAQFLPGSSTI